MALSSFFSKKVKSLELANTYFLALIITKAAVQAGLWQVSPHGILSVDSISSAKSYDIENVKDLLQACDEALQELGPDSEKTDEVIFGFEFDWVDGQEIKEDRKPLLKTLSSELSLKPIGFVVITEALLHGFEKQDSNYSLILIQVSLSQVTVTLVSQGVVKGSEKVGRSSELVSDVVEAITRFNQVAVSKALPGKMILAGIGVQTSVSRDLQQELLSHDWLSSFDFVHTPVVEVMTETQVVNSVIEEGGRAVAQAKGLMVLDSSISQESDVAEEPVSGQDQAISLAKATSQEQALSRNQDQIWNQDQTPLSGPTPPNSTYQNFALDQQTSPSSKHEHFSQSNDRGMKTDFEEITPTSNSKKSLKGKIQNWWLSHKKVVIGAFLAGILALITLTLVSSILFRQAQIELTLDEKFVSKTVLVTLDPSLKESKPEDLLLKAETTSTTVSGSDLLAATGIRLVGEKATGQVTLFNKTDSTKSFSQGTVLKSGNLRFVVTENVEVASASTQATSQDSETRTFGKSQVKVEAQDIGAEYNLAKDIEFQVADFDSSTYSAISDSEFSGGSSREVRVVSQEDLKKLYDNVKSGLAKDAETEFRGLSRNGRYVIATGQTNEISEKYDAKVGDEVNLVKLDLELEFLAVVYAQEDIKPLIFSALSEDVPEGYELSEDDLQILTDSSAGITASANADSNADSSENSSVSLKNLNPESGVEVEMQISTTATPTLDIEKMTLTVVGKPMAQVPSLLQAFQGVEEVQVKIWPSLVKNVIQSLPNDHKKITISVKPESSDQTDNDSP
jgi:hypothetical protein